MTMRDIRDMSRVIRRCVYLGKIYQGDVLQLLCVGADVCDGQACGGGHCVCNLGATEGEEQEERCADEFACCCLDGASVVDGG
jgi:hypothetical protein